MCWVSPEEYLIGKSNLGTGVEKDARVGQMNQI